MAYKIVEPACDCLDPQCDQEHKTRRIQCVYIIAAYEIDRAYGGPEEGGWWYDCGERRRILAIEHSEARANYRASRAQSLLDRLQRHVRSTGSVLYSGGRYSIEVYENDAPKYYPETRPHYE